MKSTKIMAVAAALFILSRCNHAKMLETNNSTYNSTRSHNTGENCMNCHKKGGEGEGWFVVAGSAFQPDGSPAKNITLKLYSEPLGGGTLVKTIQGDLLGNFHSTDIMGFGNGLYPVIESEGSPAYMSSSITHGACNSCHGVTEARIFTE